MKNRYSPGRTVVASTAIVAMIFAQLSPLLSPGSANAANISWDANATPDGTRVDGPGIWNTTLTNWSSDGGTTNQAFVSGDNVTFGGGASGTAGIITLGQNI